MHALNKVFKLIRRLYWWKIADAHGKVAGEMNYVVLFTDN